MTFLYRRKSWLILLQYVGLPEVSWVCLWSKHAQTVITWVLSCFCDKIMVYYSFEVIRHFPAVRFVMWNLYIWFHLFIYYILQYFTRIVTSKSKNFHYITFFLLLYLWWIILIINNTLQEPRCCNKIIVCCHLFILISIN